MTVRLALVGDYNPAVIAHRAIPPALQQASEGIDLQFDWKHTAELETMAGYDGVWCVPASPYASEAAALAAIRWARENKAPFLGTCGGFQHAVLEFGQSVAGLKQAQHAETATGDDCLLISRLACSLVEVDRPVFAVPGSKLAAICGTGEIPATYHCNFGLNPQFEALLQQHGLLVAARDSDGEVRAMELAGHPFFVGTLFQPERLALKGVRSPIIDAFVEAAEVFARADS